MGVYISLAKTMYHCTNRGFARTIHGFYAAVGLEVPCSACKVSSPRPGHVAHSGQPHPWYRVSHTRL